MTIKLVEYKCVVKLADMVRLKVGKSSKQNTINTLRLDLGVSYYSL